MFQQRSVGPKRRSGFTLAEVLVTVGIIAVLAAVVVPTIASQLNKGDVGRIVNDATNIRTGMEQFLADTRRFPTKLGQLIRAPVAASATDTGVAGQFTAAQVNRWKGPYLAKDSVALTRTGFGATFVSNPADQGFFTRVSANGSTYLALAYSPIDSLTWMQIEQASEDPTITAVTAANTGSCETGLVRWGGTATGAPATSCNGWTLVSPAGAPSFNTLYILLLPIQ